jgi:hypothetical protein
MIQHILHPVYTLGAIYGVLEQTWEDDRPKILLFPNEAVMYNFYVEICKHDGIKR